MLTIAEICRIQYAFHPVQTHVTNLYTFSSERQKLLQNLENLKSFFWRRQKTDGIWWSASDLLIDIANKWSHYCISKSYQRFVISGLTTSFDATAQLCGLGASSWMIASQQSFELLTTHTVIHLSEHLKFFHSQKFSPQWNRRDIVTEITENN